MLKTSKKKKDGKLEVFTSVEKLQETYPMASGVSTQDSFDEGESVKFIGFTAVEWENTDKANKEGQCYIALAFEDERTISVRSFNRQPVDYSEDGKRRELPRPTAALFSKDLEIGKDYRVVVENYISKFSVSSKVYLMTEEEYKKFRNA